jgi:beta-glucosidase
VTRPVLELKGFQRLALAPGETKKVEFTITPEALSFWDANMKRTVEPGEFEILIGPNSVDLKSAVLTVAADGESKPSGLARLAESAH